MSIETTAKGMSNDEGDNDEGDKINFEYYPEEKVMKFFVKEAKARDSLVKSVEIHLPLIPEPFKVF
jgi:hypothetical protein